MTQLMDLVKGHVSTHGTHKAACVWIAPAPSCPWRHTSGMNGEWPANDGGRLMHALAIADCAWTRVRVRHEGWCGDTAWMSTWMAGRMGGRCWQGCMAGEWLSG